MSTLRKSEFLAFIGHINIDIVLRVSAIGNLVSTPVSEAVETFGGTAGNFALIGSMLNFPFDIISIVSAKSHTPYIEEMKRRKINTEFIKVVDGNLGPNCYAISDGANQRYFMADGPMGTEDYIHSSKAYEYLHSSTGLPEKNMAFIETTTHNKVVFDPGQEAGSKYNSTAMKKFVDIANVIICNEHEMGIIQSLSGKKVEDMVSSGIDLIMTRGSDGTTLYHNNRKVEVKAIKAEKVVDTIGAGDSFRAGFYAALYHKYNLDFAVLCGNIVAGLTVQSGILRYNQPWENVEDMAKKLKETYIT